MEEKPGKPPRRPFELLGAPWYDVLFIVALCAFGLWFGANVL